MASIHQRLRLAHDFTAAARATYLCARRHDFSLAAAHAIARVCLSVERAGRSGAWAYDRCHQIIRKTRAANPAPIATQPTNPRAHQEPTRPAPTPPRLPINVLSPTERTLLSHYRLASSHDRRSVRNWLATATNQPTAVRA